MNNISEYFGCEKMPNLTNRLGLTNVVLAFHRPRYQESTLVGIHRNCDDNLVTDHRNVFCQTKVGSLQASQNIA